MGGGLRGARRDVSARALRGAISAVSLFSVLIQAGHEGSAGTRSRSVAGVRDPTSLGGGVPARRGIPIRVHRTVHVSRLGDAEALPPLRGGFRTQPALLQRAVVWRPHGNRESSCAPPVPSGGVYDRYARISKCRPDFERASRRDSGRRLVRGGGRSEG